MSKAKDFVNWLMHGDLLEPFRRVRAWYHDKHQIYRDFMTYNAERDRYRIDRATLVRTDVKPDDLGITGDKWHFFNTDMIAPPHEETRIEEVNGEKVVYHNLSAIALNHWAESDELINSLTGEFKPKLMNPLILAIIIVAGMSLLIFFMMGH